MNDFPRWKHYLVALVAFIGVLYAIPSLYQKQPAVQVLANKADVVDEALKERALQALQSRKIEFDDVKIKDERLLVTFPDTDSQLAASSALRADLGDKFTVALNLASTVPAWMRAIGANSMPLGLDLQGGVHFLMEVDQKSVLDGNEDLDKIAASIARDATDLTVVSGPSIGDSPSLLATIKPERIKQIADNTITQNVATLRNRINSLGVAEPMIVQQGETRIVVELPGLQDTAEAKKLLGATATLEYRAVDESANVAEVVRTGSVPPDSRVYYFKDGRPAVLKKKVIVTGDELVDASSSIDEQSGTPAVNVALNSAGARKMLDFTTQNVGKGMAVILVERTPEVRVVDGKEVRSAKITEEIISLATIRGVFSNRFQTTGLDSAKAASELALMLRSGSLAAPTLGADNIRKGFFAVVLGMLFVVVFVGIYYKAFGLIADVALLMNLVLVVAVLSIFQATLTLPGIAGIVLVLGMAVDANVLICERIREESRAGMTPFAAIRAGYEKAWSTILDANITTLIAAVSLMTFGSGPIRGFAITLSIGILTSMFTAVTGTHSLVALIFGRRKLSHGIFQSEQQDRLHALEQGRHHRLDGADGSFHRCAGHSRARLRS